MSEGARPVAATRIRLAGPGDWRALADLHVASWRSAYREILSASYLDGPVEAERQALWRDRMTRPEPATVVAIAEESERPVALACLLGGRDPRWGTLVDNLHVAPDRKRTGLGAKVLAHALRHLPATWEAEPIHLTVFDANRAARAAYEAWGGLVVERLDTVEPDGLSYPVLRYGWPSAGALRARLRA